MATSCLRRLCFRNSPFVRKIYSCESTSVAAPLQFDYKIYRKQPPCSTQRVGKIILRPSLYPYTVFRYYSGDIDVKVKKSEKEPPEKKPSLLQRFKQMYRDYWYVLVPVHLVTSAAWFGSFYYLAKSGVDIASLLESWHVSEKITNSLRDSSMGYIAVAYALYKLATPLRYTVTLGGTTISINYLKEWGYIKPVPTTNQLKEMYKERKDNIIETIKETKGFYKEKKDNIIDSVSGTKLQLKLQKEQLKDQKEMLVKDLEKGLKTVKKVKDLSPKSERLIKMTKKQDNS